MEYVIVGLVWALVVGTRLAVSWYRMRDELGGVRSARQLMKRGRRLDTTPIGEVPEASVVRVVGDVQRLDRWAVAPMSKRACAHWHLKVSVMEYSPTARHTYWRTLFERTSGLQFVLGSGDVQCCVDPSLAVVDVKRARISEAKSSRRLSADMADLLESEGVSASSLPRTKVRFEESIVSFGDKVAVVGAGRLVPRPRNEAADAGYRDAGPTWICFSGTDDDLLIADDRKLLGPRGNGGGIKTEPPRGSGTREPSQTDAWTAMDVDDFERALIAKQRRRWIALAALGALVACAFVMRSFLSRPETSPAQAVDPCDLTPLMLKYRIRGAAATRDELADYAVRCPPTVEYRRLHLAALRALGDSHGAADEAEQLLASEPTRADLWIALAADHRYQPLALIRQGFALASNAERRDATETLRTLEPGDSLASCDNAFARLELGITVTVPAGCVGVSRGHASLAVAPSRVSVHAGVGTAMATIDLGVGTTVVSTRFAEQAGLVEQYGREAMAVVAGKRVYGNVVIARSIGVEATSTNDLPVLVTNDLPTDQDVVIGLDYLWRFSRTLHGDHIELSGR